MLFAFVEKDGVDMSFKMVDGDEGNVLREGQGFGVGDADEQGAGEAGAGGDGDGVQVGECDLSLFECGSDYGNDGTEMLAAGQFGDNSTIAGVGGDLRRYDGRQRAGATLDNSGCGLVAGGLDGEDEAVTGHVLSLAS